MSISDGFFKAKNREIAQSEIVSRLGGSSEVTEFLTDYILNVAKGDARMKKFPMAVFVHESKPQFPLNDGEMLDGYAVDVVDKKEVASKYMGSADTVYLHQKEQLSEGMKTPSHIVAIFITRIPSGSKLAWTVDVVGSLQKKIESNVVIEKTDKEKTISAIQKVFGDHSSKSFSFEWTEGSFSIEFYRKVNPAQFNDVEYYLGELEAKKALSDCILWNFIILKKEDGIFIKFERAGTESISVSELRKIENKLGEFDSDLRRVKRTKLI